MSPQPPDLPTRACHHRPAAAEVAPHAAQTIDDIDASGAWWVNDLQQFNPKAQARVVRLLFSESGYGCLGGGEFGADRHAATPGDTAQRWPLNSHGQIVNEASGRCLDVDGQATAVGSEVIVCSCNGGSSEAWAGQQAPFPTGRGPTGRGPAGHTRGPAGPQLPASPPCSFVTSNVSQRFEQASSNPLPKP
ncbi:RICIN domain-containing protein [Streptomyces sp. NPDC007205]|uniref:RICIN domain-containing protein n=1 Tax=Streptomyces sp. NPDC007205 TaxID=3154316 RepID=UPI0033F9170E